MEEVGLRRARCTGTLLSAAAVLLGALTASCRSEGRAASAPLFTAGVVEIRKAVGDRRGSPVLLNFWAVWCDPCVEELPDLAGIEARFSLSGIKVLGVSCDLFIEADTPLLRRKVSETLAQAGVLYPNYLYSGGEDPLTESFALPGPIPYSILYGADGREVKRWTGRLPIPELQSALAHL